MVMGAGLLATTLGDRARARIERRDVGQQLGDRVEELTAELGSSAVMS
jgi:hypothetical protein